MTRQWRTGPTLVIPAAGQAAIPRAHSRIRVTAEACQPESGCGKAQPGAEPLVFSLLPGQRGSPPKPISFPSGSA
jgi:hypothetical protein